jgi:hypothetical protein
MASGYICIFCPANIISNSGSNLDFEFSGSNQSVWPVRTNSYPAARAICTDEQSCLIPGTDLGSRSQKRNAKQTIGTDHASNLEINYLNI